MWAVINSKAQIVMNVDTNISGTLRIPGVFQMEHFFKLHSEAGAGEMPRQQALETVHNNIRWLNNNLDEIATWLTAKVPAAV